jgi:hypothetical protein
MAGSSLGKYYGENIIPIIKIGKQKARPLVGGHFSRKEKTKGPLKVSVAL